MTRDPRDPFFEGAVTSLVNQAIDSSQLSVLVRQLQGTQLQAGSTGSWAVEFGFEAFTGLSLAQYAFTQVTLPHSIGRIPTTFFPLVSCQDASLAVQTATYTQGSMTPTTFDVTLSNPFNFALTNAQVGWAIIHD